MSFPFRNTNGRWKNGAVVFSAVKAVAMFWGFFFKMGALSIIKSCSVLSLKVDFLTHSCTKQPAYK